MHYFLLLFTLLFSSAACDPLSLWQNELYKHGPKTYNDFDSNPYISKAEKIALKNGLLPYDHPMRPILDALFHSSRATANLESLTAAGFQVVKNQPRSFILVVKHPSLPGYLIKLHLDNDLRKKKGKPGWHWFAKRIEGARAIANCIRSKNITHFKVPNKWVYPLPIEPLAPIGPEYSRKNFILIVEDMQLLSRQDNLEAWKTQITKEHLKELRTILRTCGGSSMRASNIPFSIDGKIAFIDTEYPGRTPNYRQVDPSLNIEMLHYWKKITR